MIRTLEGGVRDRFFRDAPEDQPEGRRMEQLATQRRAELYLRGDTYGTFDAQREILDRVYELEGSDAMGAVDVDWSWARIRTIGEDHRDGAIETYREFTTWADRNGYALNPAFEQRTRGFVGLDRVDDVVVFPVVSMAMYDGQDLQAVFPCADGDLVYRVQDCLDAMEDGDEDWLSQFDGVTVDRTSPRLEAGFTA